MIGHIMLLDEKPLETHEILREFARRHRNITDIYKHCKEIKGLIELGINYNGLSDERTYRFLLHHGICFRIFLPL
jgi:hypothetical protein